MKNTLLFLLFTLISCIACNNTTQNQPTFKEEEPVPVEQVPEKIATYPTKTVDNEYRNENWRPADGAYFFSELWTWNFVNELATEGEPQSGTFNIYLDPPTGTMLLADNLDEMTDWIIIHPDGNYTTAYTDVHGKPHIVKQKMTDFEDHDFKLNNQAADFKQYFRQLNGTKTFGTNQYGWETIEATPFQQTFAKTTDVSNLYLLKMPYPVRGLYLIEQTNQDLNLPINLDFGYTLPEDYLVISEDYQYSGKKVGFSLVSISPTEYFVNVVRYGVDH